MMITKFHLPAIEKGDRFCTQCRQPYIEKIAPDWKTMCGDCYWRLKDLTAEEREQLIWYCTDCSEQIPKERISFRRVETCSPCHKDRMAELPSSRRLALIESLRASLPTTI